VMQKKHTQQPTHRSGDGFDQPLRRHHVGRIWNGCAWQLGPAGSQGGQSDWAGLQDAGLWYLRLKALVYVYIYYIYICMCIRIEGISFVRHLQGFGELRAHELN
jgi:hypothetical protein